MACSRRWTAPCSPRRRTARSPCSGASRAGVWAFFRIAKLQASGSKSVFCSWPRSSRTPARSGTDRSRAAWPPDPGPKPTATASSGPCKPRRSFTARTASCSSSFSAASSLTLRPCCSAHASSPSISSASAASPSPSSAPPPASARSSTPPRTTSCCCAPTAPTSSCNQARESRVRRLEDLLPPETCDIFRSRIRSALEGFAPAARPLQDRGAAGHPALREPHRAVRRRAGAGRGARHYRPGARRDRARTASRQVAPPA